MNKQSKRNRKLALKNYHKGVAASSFEVLTTTTGSTSLSKRIHNISIGNGARKSDKPKVAAEGCKGNSKGMSLAEQHKCFYGIYSKI